MDRFYEPDLVAAGS